MTSWGQEWGWRVNALNTTKGNKYHKARNIKYFYKATCQPHHTCWRYQYCQGIYIHTSQIIDTQSLQTSLHQSERERILKRNKLLPKKYCSCVKPTYTTSSYSSVAETKHLFIVTQRWSPCISFSPNRLACLKDYPHLKPNNQYICTHETQALYSKTHRLRNIGILLVLDQRKICYKCTNNTL